MSDRPGFEGAIERVMGLTYPPRVLTVPLTRAIGHRLARAVVARGNQPSRPVALVDGLAVIARDVLLRESDSAADNGSAVDEGELEEAYEDDELQPAGGEGTADMLTGGLVNVGVDTDRRRDQNEEEMSYDEILSGSESYVADYEETEGSGNIAQESFEAAQSTVPLELRPFPPTNRREDALRHGQGVPVPVGAEVPRGADYVYPLELIAEEPSETPEVRQVKVMLDQGDNENAGPEESVTIMEVERSWDLPTRFRSGMVDAPQIRRSATRNMINIGAWARNRETIIPEKIVLRSTEIALLQTIGVEEVEVFRKPVVGIASLSAPFPMAGRNLNRDDQRGICPLMQAAVELSRSAQIATLALGFAPLRYHELVHAVERWMDQVDLLVLAGGSHHGVRCLGHDVLATRGQLALTGTALAPLQSLSVGRIKNKPVFVVPGSLPELVSAMVLFVRPLAHKYLTPRNFSDCVTLELERGSQLYVEQDTVVPVRYGHNRSRDTNVTRFSGRGGDEWMEYIAGQALVVLQGRRRYSDGESVRGYVY